MINIYFEYTSGYIEKIAEFKYKEMYESCLPILKKISEKIDAVISDIEEN